MNIFSILNKDDYLDIKGQIAFAIIGIILAAGIYLGAESLSADSLLDLRVAQSEFDVSRSRVELIEEEESRVIEYIERYKVLEGEGAVKDEDRLLMHELIAQIRAEHNLFPVALNMAEQATQNLSYPPELRDPGDPVALRSSIIKLTLPLLHEEDLTRLLNGLLDSPGLFQTKQCNITQQSQNLRNFVVLSQHFAASCEILWYSFDLEPPPPPLFGY